ncbi:hypothetical protein [Streptomyces sp. NBC_01637]|uniref:hypothetical protein n=1 Tax=unclassified Streptomyces TaxID=2593676 RepID=UPI0038683E8A|nr:hypothetical protein OH719_21735 [Streptomyces sp. NBC_01653]WTD90610.1 hypothetical protein OG891_25145 [Streptomyces sp. NBC_01637]
MGAPARTAVCRDDVLDVTDDLAEEMHDRLDEIPRGSDVIAISANRPRITVFVDEGAQVISMTKFKASRTEDGPGPDCSRIMEKLRTLARMARVAEILLIWTTQKPTMDGESPGLDPQISAQIIYRAPLALSTSSEARVVFGEDATEESRHAHKPDPRRCDAPIRAQGQAHPVKTPGLLPGRRHRPREPARMAPGILQAVQEPPAPGQGAEHRHGGACALIGDQSGPGAAGRPGRRPDPAGHHRPDRNQHGHRLPRDQGPHVCGGSPRERRRHGPAPAPAGGMSTPA